MSFLPLNLQVARVGAALEAIGFELMDTAPAGLVEYWLPYTTTTVVFQDSPYQEMRHMLQYLARSLTDAQMSAFMEALG